MAEVARVKGVPIEISTFESWQPAERHLLAESNRPLKTASVRGRLAVSYGR